MLRYRVLTAAILIPLVVWGVFYLPLEIFAFASAFVFLLGAWEWAGLCKLNKLVYRFFYLLFTFCFFWIIGAAPPIYILFAALITWLLLPIFLKRPDLWYLCCESKKSYKLFLGVWILSLAWYAVNLIMSSGYGSLMLMTLFVWVWGADIGAYFAGKKWGKHKLAPKISPGKTKEGVIGGAIVTFVLAIIMGFFYPFGLAYHIGLLILSLIVVVFSVIGDLVESLIKRQSNVKDSGGLLPGHGGVLDRIDSLLSAAPIFAIGVFFLAYFK